MVGDIFMAGISRKLQAFEEVESTPGGGEKQRNVIFIHRDTLSAAANIAGRTFVVLPLASRRGSTF